MDLAGGTPHSRTIMGCRRFIAKMLKPHCVNIDLALFQYTPPQGLVAIETRLA